MTQVLIAGFGGQGILFAGRLLAYASMLRRKEVTWLPSYGPESRGGTSNCSVIVSDTPIGSPLVLEPDILICLNLPSLDKFESALAEGGALFADSSLAERKAVLPEGRTAYYVPATKLAYDNGMDGLANMIMMGKVMRERSVCDREAAGEAIRKLVSGRRQDMLELNLKALDMGLGY
jgi:2-oxoglutarate ferredoxin oxidoreductase subunit gamma